MNELTIEDWKFVGEETSIISWLSQEEINDLLEETEEVEFI